MYGGVQGRAQANILLYVNMNIQKLKFVSFHCPLTVFSISLQYKRNFPAHVVYIQRSVHQFQTIFCLLLTDRNQAFVVLTVEFVWFRQSLLLTTINQI